MKPLVIWLIKGLVLSVIIITMVFLRSMLQTLRVDLYRANAELELRPQIESQAVALKMDLEKNDDAIKKVQALIPSKDELNVFIEQLSGSAQDLGVNLTVPTVEEKTTLDARGLPVTAQGPLADIHMQLVGSGDADALVQFLHVLETAPFVVTVESFHLEAVSTRTVPGSFMAPQAQPTNQPAPVKVQKGYLEVNVTIAVKNANQTKK